MGCRNKTFRVSEKKVYCHIALSRLVTLSISSLRNLGIEANKFYERVHRLYDAAIHTIVILNMLFDLILTQKLIILGILSKFSLSIKERISFIYSVYLKINL